MMEKAFDFTYRPSVSHHSFTYNLDPSDPNNNSERIDVYSGYENNWIKDSFGGDGNHLESKIQSDAAFISRTKRGHRSEW